jgi:hypothetical protein
LSDVQSEPVAALPLLQEQALGAPWQEPSPWRIQPWLQVPQIAALFEVQLAPVAAFPFEQVQVFAWQTTFNRVQPVSQLPQFSALLILQFAPTAATPFEQVQVFAWQETPLGV